MPKDPDILGWSAETNCTLKIIAISEIRVLYHHVITY